MKAYMDKFRGFDNQLVCLEKVNFLVGENSTGKTSLMLAIGLFSNPDFWMNSRLTKPDGSQYSFEDLLTSGESQDEYFTLGRTLPKGSDEEGVILSFSSRRGRPRMKRIVYFHPKWIYVAEEVEDSKWGLNSIPTAGRTFAKFATDKEWQNFKASNSQIITIELNNESMINFFLAGFKIIINKEEIDSDDASAYKRLMGVESAAENLTKWGRAKQLDPIRPKPRKIYSEVDADDAVSAPAFIRDAAEKDGKIIQIMNDFGKQSGLFNRINYKNYGGSHEQDAPFKIIVNIGDREVDLANVGYGVSQALPIICNFTDYSDIFMIQQPEVHLHPRAQSAMGEYFYQAGKKRSGIFLIETHSDFILDRFRRKVRESETDPKSQVLFFSRSNNKNEIAVIPINSSGQYDGESVDEFRRFFLDEQLENLGL